MGCLWVIIALLAPRLFLLLIWLLTNWPSRAFDTVLWPLLGTFLMPYTTLTYMAGMLNAQSIEGGWLLLLIAAVLFDILHLGMSTRVQGRRKLRIPKYEEEL